MLLAWLCVLAPTLALAAIGLLGSVALGRSPMGLLLPAVVALAMQLAQILPLPVAVRLALPGRRSSPGTACSPARRSSGPLLIGVAVSLAWAVLATALAYLLFLRRDFTNLTYDGAGRRASSSACCRWPRCSPLAVVVCRRDPGHRLRDRAGQGAALARHGVRPPLPPADPAAAPPRRHRGAAADHRGLHQGRRPGRRRRARQRLALRRLLAPARHAAVGHAIYQLDVTANGRYIADGDGPKEVNGYFLVRTPQGMHPTRSGSSTATSTCSLPRWKGLTPCR